jgi:serine/threonine protein kinase
VHRDVKPGNVLIGRDGRVRLTDFGIARLVDSARVTSTGMMVGTASFLAPEQVAGEPVGPPADVYALGLVLLECLTGQREYAGSTVEVALARLQRLPRVPATLPAGWPGLLRAMTAREPADRPSPPTRPASCRRSPAAARRPPCWPTGSRWHRRRASARRCCRRRRPFPGRRGAATRRAPPPRSNWPMVVLLLLLAAVIGAGAVYLSQVDRGTTEPLPAIELDLPEQLRTELDQLQREVES